MRMSTCYLGSHFQILPCRRKTRWIVIKLVHYPCSLKWLGKKQWTDSSLSQVVRYLENDNWPPKEFITGDSKPYFKKRYELSLQNGVILWNLREIIPNSLQNEVLCLLHQQHPGIVRMKALSRIHVWFPGIDTRIQDLVNSCSDCAKVANCPSKLLPHFWDWTSKPVDRVHLDFFYPFHGNTSLIIVDNFSGWIEAKIMKNMQSSTTIDVLRCWFARFGIPKQIITDNGSQFTSRNFMTSLEIMVSD